MDTSPTLHLQRPLPPASRKRSSNHASGTSSRSDSPAPREDAGMAALAPEEDQAEADHNYEAEVEKALMGLSREDLVMALGRAKTQMDNLDSRLEEQTLLWEQSRATNLDLQSKLGLAEAEADSLSHAVSARDARMDELLSETERLEADVYAKLGLVERLRAQLAEADRRAAEAERQYVDQTNTAEQERRYFADLEGLLKKQKDAAATAHEKLARQNRDLVKENERVRGQLAQAKGAGVPIPEAVVEDDAVNDVQQDQADEGDAAEQDDAGQDGQPKASTRTLASARSRRTLADDMANDEELASLRSELELVQRSHASLTSTMHTLQAELRDVKASNSVLRDECETYRDILQEKTFSGALLARSAVLSGYRSGETGAKSETPGGSDEDEDDDDDEGLRTGETSTTDDVDDVPDAPPAAAAKVTKESARKRRELINKSSHQFLSPPPDLASELEGAEEDAEERRRKKRKEREEQLPSDVAYLQKEVIELRDANKALTLYISKIIDRIIAREGYENVLAKDGDGVGKLSLAGANATIHRRSSKAKLSGVPEEKAMPAPPAESRAAKRASGILSFGAGSLSPAPAGGVTSPGERPAKPRRSGSLDWRSLLGGVAGGGGGDAQSENPHLRPLTLQGAAASSVGSSATTSTGPPIVSGRRLTPTEEDVQDGIERERIRAALEMQGIELPEHQLQPSPAVRGLGASPNSSPTSASKRASGAFSSFFSRVVPGSAFGPGVGGGGVGVGVGAAAAASATNGAGGSPRAPRLTTFDDPTPARPQRDNSPSPLPRVGASTLRTGINVVDPYSSVAPSGAGLTEYKRPNRSSRTRGPGAARSAAGDESRTSSTAGDESYAIRRETDAGDVE